MAAKVWTTILNFNVDGSYWYIVDGFELALQERYRRTLLEIDSLKEDLGELLNSTCIQELSIAGIIILSVTL